MEQKILYKGTIGFITSQTAVELITEGYEVVIVDDLSNAQLFILDNIEIITRDRPAFYNVGIQNLAPLQKVFAAEKTLLHYSFI